MPKTISSTEANRHFAEVLRQIDEGETFIVTSHGRPRIRMERVSEDVLEREAATERFLTHFEMQPGHPITPWTRDELYDDEADVRRQHLEFLDYLRTLPLRIAGPWTRDELYDDDLEPGQ